MYTVAIILGGELYNVRLWPWCTEIWSEDVRPMDIWPVDVWPVDIWPVIFEGQDNWPVTFYIYLFMLLYII